MESKKWKNKNFGVALLHSLNGMKYTFQTETNLKIQLLFAIIAIGAGMIVSLDLVEWLILCLTIGMVISAEIINTAIEMVLDLYSETYNEKIKLAKDISSGAVLVTAIVSIIVGCILFLPKI